MAAAPKVAASESLKTYEQAMVNFKVLAAAEKWTKLVSARLCSVLIERDDGRLYSGLAVGHQVRGEPRHFCWVSCALVSSNKQTNNTVVKSP